MTVREVRTPFQRARIGDLDIDFASRTVRRGGLDLDLPDLSFRVLAALAEAWPEPVSADLLMAKAWGGVTVSGDAVKQRIRAVRTQLGSADAPERYVRTVRGRGYRLAAPVAWLPAEAPAPPRRADRPFRTGFTVALASAVAVAGAAAVFAADSTPRRQRGIAERAYTASTAIRIAAIDSAGPERAAAARTALVEAFEAMPLASVVVADGATRASGASVFDVSVETAATAGGARLTLRIADDANETDLWSRSFDVADDADVREAASAAAAALHARIAGDARVRLEWMKAGERLDYLAYLHGLELAERRDWDRAIAALATIVERDPCFAMAHAALAAALVERAESALAGDLAARRADLERGIRHADAAIAEYAELPEALAARDRAASALVDDMPPGG